jgi:hypothetical protein
VCLYLCQTCGVASSKKIISENSKPHIIIICNKISHTARKFLNSCEVYWEHWPTDFMINILDHKDVPSYEQVHRPEDIESQYGPKKSYSRLVSDEDPVCKILDMRPGQVWVAQMNIPGVGIHTEPRLIV